LLLSQEVFNIFLNYISPAVPIHRKERGLFGPGWKLFLPESRKKEKPEITVTFGKIKLFLYFLYAGAIPRLNIKKIA